MNPSVYTVRIAPEQVSEDVMKAAYKNPLVITEPIDVELPATAAFFGKIPQTDISNWFLTQAANKFFNTAEAGVDTKPVKCQYVRSIFVHENRILKSGERAENKTNVRKMDFVTAQFFYQGKRIPDFAMERISYGFSRLCRTPHYGEGHLSAEWSRWADRAIPEALSAATTCEDWY